MIVKKVACVTMIAVVPILFLCCTQTPKSSEFQSNWIHNVERIWPGPEYWTNRLQDWRIKDGRLECLIGAEDRNVHILTRQLGPRSGGLEMSVRLGVSGGSDSENADDWAGFRIGAKGRFNDYRDSAIYGKGLNAGIRSDGRLFIGRYVMEKGLDEVVGLKNLLGKGLELRVRVESEGEKYRIELSGYDPESKSWLHSIEQDTLSTGMLSGNLALVSHLPGMKKGDDDHIMWFSDWQISGSKVVKHEDQAFGPVLFTQYTLSKSILKMTAQMAPVGKMDGRVVYLQIRKGRKNWQTINEAGIDKMARTATFRIEDWDGSRDTPFRLVYGLYQSEGKMMDFYYTGLIRKEPLDKEEIVVAGFTGNNDLGFPNNDMVEHVNYHDPDLLFFSGDQIYERVAGYGVQRTPMDKACLDYLRKWYLFGWAYGDLLKDRPTVSIPDDHDVYHGNIWGDGGKATPPGLTGSDAQDEGGYKMPPEWVNMVQRTQTSHLPDPHDSTPVEQDIGVYYCDMSYGGISFAILEDRKFKSPPKKLLPKAKVRNGWAQNKKFNTENEADVPGAKLLGARQLQFLADWSADWSQNTWMKVVLSQTIFANVATLPEEAMSDEIVPRLRILVEGEYPTNDNPVSDMDSNGWPQTGRNKALREMRRGFAFHLAGDQHLGSMVQYGVEEWNDASFAFCVPAISNIWPRRWCPSTSGRNRKPDSSRYTGEFKDGFGNKITVHAVSNPVYTGIKPSNLYDRATGYGIVRFNKMTRDITIECWPRWVDPSGEDPLQYPGWPIKINQLDNYGRKAVKYLPTIRIQGMTDPVIQVVDEENNEIVYTLRVRGQSFSPKVFKEGSYTIVVGEPGTEQLKRLERIQSMRPGETGYLNVKF